MAFRRVVRKTRAYTHVHGLSIVLSVTVKVKVKVRGFI